MVNTNIVRKINDLVTWTIEVINGATHNNGVYVSLNIPSNFTVLSSVASQGSLTGNQWTIGNMIPGQKEFITVNLKLSTIPSNNQLQLIGTVFGLDTNIANNTVTDTVNYIKEETPSCEPKPPCNDDPCAEPDVNIIDIELDTPLKIKFGIPVKCDHGTTIVSYANVENCEIIDFDPTTGNGYVDITNSNSKLPWSFEYYIDCKVKCFARKFGPGKVSGIGFCQPIIEASDNTARGIVGTSISYDLMTDTVANANCEPVTWNIISDTTGTATVTGSTLNVTAQDINETILWDATCADGTTIDQGILTLNSDPVKLTILDGQGNEITFCTT